MSSYNELIKNFEKIRSYIREFYVYGLKSREQYHMKSSRSYDDERRRIESWFGKYTQSVRTSSEKNVFISVDTRISQYNPFYKAFKSKSFTAGDITLHFILLDILHSSDTLLSLTEIIDKVDEYLINFDNCETFDESTIRKKLKEYTDQGILCVHKTGKKIYYSRVKDCAIPDISDAVNFYSEVSPCGVIGSFILDKLSENNNFLFFKHHYITSALDSDVVAMLFKAMHNKCVITAVNHGGKYKKPKKIRIIPLKILISVQNGRQHLLAYLPEYNIVTSFRIDYLSDIKLDQQTPRYDELRSMVDDMQTKMWGVTTSYDCFLKNKTEHIEFTIRVEDGEEYVASRLIREKRIGCVEKIDNHTYRFVADMYDATEIIPWVRTFIGNLTSVHFSDKSIENRFKTDIEQMYRIYNIQEP